MPPPLETARLLLRPLELADAEQAQPLFGQWEVVKQLAALVPWPYPPDGALTHYRDVLLPMVARGEAWAWSLRLRSDPERLIGAVTLYRREEENRGFWIGLPWQGQGLMTEACDAATAYWFEVLGFPVLRTSKARANVASCRISQRQGMRVVRVEERDTVSGRLPTEFHELTSAEWRARSAARVG